MKPKHFPLFTEAATDLASGGGAAVETQAAETPAAAAPEAPAAPEQAAAPEPTFLQKVAAGLQSKGHLIAENATLLQRATTAESLLVKTSAELDAANARLSTLETERAEIQKLLTEAKAEKETVEQKAVAEIAAIGFAADKLPESAKAGETREELEAQLAATPVTDNARRWELAEKLNALG